MAEYAAVKEVADAARRGESIDPGDVADAGNAYRELYDFLLDDPAAP